MDWNKARQRGRGSRNWAWLLMMKDEELIANEARKVPSENEIIN